MAAQPGALFVFLFIISDIDKTPSGVEGTIFGNGDETAAVRPSQSDTNRSSDRGRADRKSRPMLGRVYSDHRSRPITGVEPAFRNSPSTRDQSKAVVASDEGRSQFEQQSQDAAIPGEYRERLTLAELGAKPGGKRVTSWVFNQTAGGRPEMTGVLGPRRQPSWGRMVMTVAGGIRRAWRGDGHARAARREHDWYRF